MERSHVFFKKGAGVLKENSKWVSYVWSDEGGGGGGGGGVRSYPTAATMLPQAAVLSTVTPLPATPEGSIIMHQVLSEDITSLPSESPEGSVVEAPPQRNVPSVPLPPPPQPSEVKTPGAWLPSAMFDDNNSWRATRGISKAVLVACDYHGTGSKCADSFATIEVLRGFLQTRGFCRELRVLTDNNPAALPTRGNIIASMRWLTDRAGPGDTLLFAFVGHGGNLSLAPSNHATEGFITQADFLSVVARNLGVATKLLVFSDFCRGGSLLDLPHRLCENGQAASAEVVAVQHHSKDGYAPHILSFAGNRAQQASIDVVGDTLVPFVTALHSLHRPTYHELLLEAVSYLRLTRAGPFARFVDKKPVLELSSSRPFSVHDEFVLCQHVGGDREEEMFREIFGFADRDGDGFLNYRDMQFLCSSLGKAMTRTAYDNLAVWCNASTGLTLADLKLVYSSLSIGQGYQDDYRAILSLKEEEEEAARHAPQHPRIHGVDSISDDGFLEDTVSVLPSLNAAPHQTDPRVEDREHQRAPERERAQREDPIPSVVKPGRGGGRQEDDVGGGDTLDEGVDVDRYPLEETVGTVPEGGGGGVPGPIPPESTSAAPLREGV